MARDHEVQAGEIVGPWRTYSLREVCVICGVDDDQVVALVSFGVIEPTAAPPAQWAFSEDALARSKKALRLRRDLGLDLPGLALVLDLLDEIDRLRAGRPARLSEMRGVRGAQPPVKE
jgi:chaperone modulatory protein CbpM